MPAECPTWQFSQTIKSTFGKATVAVINALPTEAHEHNRPIMALKVVPMLRHSPCDHVRNSVLMNFKRCSTHSAVFSPHRLKAWCAVSSSRFPRSPGFIVQVRPA